MIWFNASFVAVPAFSLVEPATTSGPTFRTTTMSASRESSLESLAVNRTVRAPFFLARASAPRAKGVTELAETAITRSRGRVPRAPRSPSPERSSAPSRARKTAPRPPAMTARTRRGSVPNVGGSSAASSTASLPLVPAPKRKQIPPARNVSRNAAAARVIAGRAEASASSTRRSSDCISATVRAIPRRSSRCDLGFTRSVASFFHRFRGADTSTECNPFPPRRFPPRPPESA